MSSGFKDQNMKNIIILFLVGLGLTGYGQINMSDDAKVIQKSMDAQVAAWNKGSIEGFMEYYWNNDSLKFVGSKGTTYGWKKTLENYKKTYPDKESMGVLTFENNTIEQLTPVSFFVIGKWKIKKKDNTETGGVYTLVWKKKKGKWVITVDHTS